MSYGTLVGAIPLNVDVITLGLYVGTDLISLDGSFDGYNDGKLGGFLLGGLLVSTDGKVIGSNDGINLKFTDGKVIGDILGLSLEPRLRSMLA